MATLTHFQKVDSVLNRILPIMVHCAMTLLQLDRLEGNPMLIHVPITCSNGGTVPCILTCPGKDFKGAMVRISNWNSRVSSC